LRANKTVTTSPPVARKILASNDVAITTLTLTGLNPVSGNGNASQDMYAGATLQGLITAKLSSAPVYF
jgi:hypothetical protein